MRFPRFSCEISLTIIIKFTLFEIHIIWFGVVAFFAGQKVESGIEFYAWDFDFNETDGFKADILIDKTGKQTHAFKAVNYQVAVKVGDNEGIESIEIITLKTNGILEI